MQQTKTKVTFPLLSHKQTRLINSVNVSKQYAIIVNDNYNEQLSTNYKLYINRVQKQLKTPLSLKREQLEPMFPHPSFNSTMRGWKYETKLTKKRKIIDTTILAEGTKTSLSFR